MRQLLVGCLIIFAAACGGPSRDPGGPDAASCSPGDPPRCQGTSYQECQGGEYVTQQTCPDACSPTMGCVECDPNQGAACDGNAVVSCNPDGTFGSVIETCDAGQECMDGSCQRACTADGVDLIYVVDQNYNFLSFDPRLIGTGADPFHLIGALNCPAGTPYPSWQAINPVATPFSMSVDRTGVAWVLYTSGEIFNVNIQNAACTPTTFQKTQQGSWYLFGMGYSTDTAGGDTEKLYIAGGPEQPIQGPGAMTGYIVPTTLQFQTVGSVNVGENSPEMTGTGDAALFGYFPGNLSNGFVQEISKATGNVTSNPMTAGPVSGGPSAWAFAQWGGKFYIFVTDSLGSSQVQVVDRATGSYDGPAPISDPYVIVGAGVSTCAPVVIQ
jgi:hypothetical protein